MKHKKYLWDASKVYCPEFPRQGADDEFIQAPRPSRADLVAGLTAASEGGNPGFYSVYSFPYGHPKDDVVPKVDCIFIDLDVVTEDYDPNADPPETDFVDWERAMSALLARARMIASALLDRNADQYFRAVLSGHKGIHLYFDFPPIAPSEGEFNQFKNGLRAYGEDVMAWLDGLAGGVNILPWVDVDGSDLARLGRHPNTINPGAAYDDTTRWCVPVTIEELASIDVDDYLRYTEGPRPITDAMHRTPSERAGKEAIQRIRGASAGRSRSGGSTYDPALVDEYKETCNDNLELTDLLDPLIMGNKPCIQAFRERDDAYTHGQESRMMELSIMGRFIEMGVPFDVMHEFFEPIPGYDEETTDEMLVDLIARSQGEFNCSSIAGGYDMDGKRIHGQATRFCLGPNCKLYRNSDDIQFHDSHPPDA